MASILASIRPYSASLDTWGENLITSFFNPSVQWATRPQNGWLLADFSTALYVALGYVALVAVGFIVKNSAAPQKALAKKPAAEGKPARVSVGEKFAKEPVLILQTVYNFVQVALCGYMMYESIRIAYNENVGPFCQAFDASKPTFANVLWLFYASKVLDFFDTFFIIVRGKWNQFIFLHYYHHFSIFLVYWLVSNAGNDGEVWLTIALNSFIHFVMYSYYFFSTLNIRVPWGPLVTKAQQIQFVVMIGQGLTIVIKKCAYPNNIASLYIVYIASLLALFAAFDAVRWGRKTASKGPKTVTADGGKSAPKSAAPRVRAASAAKPAAKPSPRAASPSPLAALPVPTVASPVPIAAPPAPIAALPAPRTKSPAKPKTRGVRSKQA